MDTQLLKQEIAKHHHESLSENDPIFMAVTVNDLVLSHYVDKVNTAIEESRKQITASTTQEMEAAKESTSKLITNAAEYIAKQMTTVHDELQTKLLKVVDQKIADAHLATEEIRTSKRIALWAAFVSVAAVSFTVGGWLATLGHK